MSLLTLLASQEEVVTGVVLTINGIEREMLAGWQLAETANGRASFTCELLSDLEIGGGGGFGLSLLLSSSGDSVYRPALDDEVILREDGEIIFGGFITGFRERSPEFRHDEEAPIISMIQASDYNVLATRDFVSESLPSGTLKAKLEAIVPYIEGVTLDPAQVDGPVIDAVDWEDVKTEDALNQLCEGCGGWIWEITKTKTLRVFEPGTVPCPFNIVGLTEEIGEFDVEPTRRDYANRIIVRAGAVRAQADDAVEQAAHGRWVMPYQAPENTSLEGCQAMADAILARSTVQLKRVRYRTTSKGVVPGQTQTITMPTHNLNNLFLITEVTTQDRGGDFVERTVLGIEGLVYQTGWREDYKRWNGNAAAIAGGGFGGGGAKRYAYFLGGSGVEAVESPTPTWVPVSGGNAPGGGSVHVQLNTVDRGGTSATITARLRAFSAGVSVQARLFDVTTGLPCPGLSAVVTSTAWTTVAFGVTLTPGSHLYELQLLPGAPNEPVFGVAHVE